MPANEYFKAAANALRQAGQEKKREADDLRRYVQQREVDTKDQVGKLKTQITLHEVQLGNPNNQLQMEKPHLLRMVNDLTSRISQTEADLKSERINVLQQIKNLQAEVDAINSQASQLETRM